MNRHEKHLSNLKIIAEDIVPVAAARVAASLVLNNKVISYGINSLKTSPFQKKFGKNSNAICFHAEVEAIKNALKKRVSLKELSMSTLYVARMKKKSSYSTYCDQQGIAKPCLGCSRAIASFDIKKVYYTLDDRGYDCL